MNKNLPPQKEKARFRVLGVPVNRKTFVEWKIYFDRTRMYLGYINFIMLAYVFLNSIEDVGLRSFLDEYKLIIYPFVMLLFILISLWLGRMDTKLGMRAEELRNYSASNPVMMEILDAVNELKQEKNLGPNLNKENSE